MNLETANNAILSDFFWDSLKVFGAISKLLLGLMRWAESCSCHGNLDLEEATVEQRRMWETCPMRGRRAPDMVMGGFWDEEERLSATLSVDLLASFCHTLAAADRALLIQNYEHGLAHLRFVFAMRLGHWHVDPWLLFGLAHSCREHATQALAHCIASPCGHPKYRYLRTELLEEAQRFFDGDDLALLPGLAAFMAELRFAPTVERSIEGEHAQV